MTRLAISLLGRFQVTLNGEPVTYFGSDTARALLAYLALHRGTPFRRDALAGLLWPEHTDARARHNLRAALSRLRTAIGDRDAEPPLLQVGRQTILLSADEQCSVDVGAMRRALESARAHAHEQIERCDECAEQLRQATAFYRGEFLAGFSLDSAPFEEWMVVEREGLHWQALEALQSLAAYHEQRGDYAGAIECARRQVELEPWREAAHRQWMRALALSGHRGAALAQYEACRQVLAGELGVEPEAETAALYEHIREGALVSPAVAAPDRPPVEARVEAAPLPPAASTPIPLVGPSLEGERRFVTVVQAEMDEPADLLARVDVEEWAEMASQLLRALGAEVHRLDGEVDRYDERGLVASFGARAAHEDDPERGVLAALAMQDVVQDAFQAEWAQWAVQETGGAGAAPQVGLRVGVHTGEVIVTPVEGSDASGRVALMGEAVSSARRLSGLAAVGQVWVGEPTYRLVARLFEWAGQESTDSGVGGYVPLAHKPDADKGRGIPGMRSPLVGRDREFQALREAVVRLQSGIGGIVTLVGEAGIGKSRLVAEVRKSPNLRSSNLKWIEGRCLSYGGTMAYLPWLDVLRALLGLTEDAPPALSGRVLREQVRALGREQTEVAYACLGRLLSLPLDAEAERMVSQLDAEDLQSRTMEAVQALLERAAGRQPLIVVCEDLHWADPTSLALLERLMVLPARVPLLFLCLFRPNRAHGCWQIRETAHRAYPHRHLDLQLEPLSAADGEKLLQNLLHSMPGPGGRQTVEGLSPALKERIFNWGAGNPFYVEEILRALIQSGVIECDEVSCRWQAGEGPEIASIPETLYGVLRARIDGLPPGARSLLQLAAVIGRVFTHRMLAEIAARSLARELDEHLKVLLREQMIRERARLPEAEYIFNHQLTLEAAYGGLLRRVRRVLHRRVAQALEAHDPNRAYPERVGEQLGLLAYHWEQAGENERAVAYLRRAGEQAAAQYANQEALGYLNRAMNLISHDDLAGRYSLLSAREMILDRQGDREAQREDIAQLLEIAAALDDGGSVTARRLALTELRAANFHDHVWDLTALTRAAERAARLAQSAGDLGLEAQSHLQWGTGIYRRAWDLASAREHWYQALDLARKAGDRYQEAQVLRELGNTINKVDEFDLAKEYHERAQLIYHELGDQTGEGRALNTLAQACQKLNDLAAAYTYIGRGLRLCRLTGSRREEAYALSTQGNVLARLGQYDACETRVRQALRLFRQVQDLFGETVATIVLARAAHNAGDQNASREHGERARQLADAAHAGFMQALGALSLGDALGSLACWQDALDAYRRALDLCEEQDWLHWAVSARAGLARVALARAEPEETLAQVREIFRHVEAYPTLPGTHDPMRVYLTLYRGLRSANDVRAGRVLQTAHRQLIEWADRIDDEALRRSYLENVPANREIVAEYVHQKPGFSA